MEDGGIFRSAFRGFNKADVLGYIDQITGEWETERQELATTTSDIRKECQQAVAQRDSLQSTADELREQNRSLLSKLEETDSRVEALSGQLTAAADSIRRLEEEKAKLTESLSAAEAENRALHGQLTSAEEKCRVATTEMMAAEEHLQTRESELNDRNRQLTDMESCLERYEAILGQTDGIGQHMDGIVRPFMEESHVCTDQTLERVSTALGAALEQLGELRTSVDGQRGTLREKKQTADARLADRLNEWMTQAREAAEQAAERVTRFFR